MSKTERHPASLQRSFPVQHRERLEICRSRLLYSLGVALLSLPALVTAGPL